MTPTYLISDAMDAGDINTSLLNIQVMCQFIASSSNFTEIDISSITLDLLQTVSRVTQISKPDQDIIALQLNALTR